MCGAMRAVAAALPQANRCVFTGEPKTRSSAVRYRTKMYVRFQQNDERPAHGWPSRFERLEPAPCSGVGCGLTTHWLTAPHAPNEAPFVVGGPEPTTPRFRMALGNGLLPRLMATCPIVRYRTEEPRQTGVQHSAFALATGETYVASAGVHTPRRQDVAHPGR